MYLFVKGTVWYYGRYSYELCCRELDNIDTALMPVGKYIDRSRKFTLKTEDNLAVSKIYLPTLPLINTIKEWYQPTHPTLSKKA